MQLNYLFEMAQGDNFFPFFPPPHPPQVGMSTMIKLMFFSQIEQSINITIYTCRIYGVYMV